MSIPATSEVFIDGIRGVVTFEMLKPDPLLGLIKPGLKLQDIIDAATGGDKDQGDLPATMESSGQTASLIVNLSMYIVAILVFLFAILIIYIATKFKKYKAKMTRIIYGIK